MPVLLDFSWAKELPRLYFLTPLQLSIQLVLDTDGEEDGTAISCSFQSLLKDK